MLSEAAIADLLKPYLAAPSAILPKLSDYLDLLLKWNARTNLTAIREPEEIVRRHFGESLFAARHLGACDMLLDLGSGAGFPGLPIALLRSEIHVALAESQGKKAAFLREVVRTLNLSHVEVWAGRAEAMPPERRFHTVTLRAVDNMAAALSAAESRATQRIVILTSDSTAPALPNFPHQTRIAIPDSYGRILLTGDRELTDINI